MMIGICTSIENIKSIKSFGFDYLEYFLAPIVNMDNCEFDELLEKIKKYSISTEVCCIFFPGDFKISGPCVNFDAVKKYIDKALYRANKLDTKIAIIGSGGSRNCPDGFEYDLAVKQFEKTLIYAGNCAAKYNIKIAIEHLNRLECNIINSLKSAYDLALCVNLENVGVVADGYHMLLEDEDFNVILDVKDKLIHAHIAQDKMRRYINEVNPDCELFIKKLKDAGFKKRISVEAKGDLEKESAVSYKNLKIMVE